MDRAGEGHSVGVRPDGRATGCEGREPGPEGGQGRQRRPCSRDRVRAFVEQRDPGCPDTVGVESGGERPAGYQRTDEVALRLPQLASGIAVASGIATVLPVLPPGSRCGDDHGTCPAAAATASSSSVSSRTDG